MNKGLVAFLRDITDEDRNAYRKKLMNVTKEVFCLLLNGWNIKLTIINVLLFILFSSACFAREHAKTCRKLKVQALDQNKVANRKRRQH